MNPADLAMLALANTLGAASPGPDVLLVTRQATRSRKHAIATSLGVHVGAFMWIALTVFGAAALLTTFPAILEAVQILGGGWLIWMGQSLFRQGWATRYERPIDIDTASESLGTLGHAFRLGLTTNLSNPKIVLFLSSITVPLLPHHPSFAVQLLVVAVLISCSLGVFLTLSFVVSTRAIQLKLLGASSWIDIGSGIVFMCLGALLISRGIWEILA